MFKSKLSPKDHLAPHDQYRHFHHPANFLCAIQEHPDQGIDAESDFGPPRRDTFVGILTCGNVRDKWVRAVHSVSEIQDIIQRDLDVPTPLTRNGLFEAVRDPNSVQGAKPAVRAKLENTFRTPIVTLSEEGPWQNGDERSDLSSILNMSSKVNTKSAQEDGLDYQPPSYFVAPPHSGAVPSTTFDSVPLFPGLGSLCRIGHLIFGKMKPIGFRIEEGLLRVMVELLNTSACMAGTSDCGVQLQHSTMEAPVVWTGKSVSKDAIYLSIISRRKYKPRSASDEVKMEAYLHGRPGKWEVEIEPSLYSRSVSKAETYATIIWVLQQVGYLGCTPRHARPFAAEDRPRNVLVPTGIEPFPKPSSFALLGVSFSVGLDTLVVKQLGQSWKICVS